MHQPNAVAFTVAKLVEEVLAGKVRIPGFQRPLRWQWENVRRLFDSIVRGYPIGSLLLWARSAEAQRIQFGSLAIDAPALNEALWVVDGQQRLTSLVCALTEEGSKDPRFQLAYDLATQRFERPSDRDELLLPLPILFDLPRFLKWFAARPAASEYMDDATRVTAAIRQYSIPAYVVQQQDEAVIVDIFDRMNNYGKRLTRAEVFSALHGAGLSSERPRSLSDIADHIDSHLGFGPLDEDTVLRAVLARRGPDVTREIRVEFDGARVSREFPGESPDDAYRSTETALELAVRFLRDDAGVPHFGFLAYRYLLVVLTRFFAHHPSPVRRNRDLLRRWLWRAAIVGPRVARGAYTSAMRTLAACVIPNDESGSVESLLASVDGFDLGFSLPARFKSTTAEIRFVLCALWSLQPRSVSSGAPYERSDLSRALDGQRTASDSLEVLFRREPGARSRTGNRVFVLGDDTIERVRERLAGAPDDAPEACDPLLASHAMTSEMSLLLRTGDAPALLSAREARIEQVTRDFLARMTEADFEDTPPLDDLVLDDEDSEGRDDALA